MIFHAMLQAVPDSGQVAEAFGGGLAGLLAVIVVSLAGLLWLTLNARLKDCKDSLLDSRDKEEKLIEKLGPLTATIERQNGMIEAMSRELERRGRGTR